MTKWYSEHIRKIPRRDPPPADNIVISDTGGSVKDYVCSNCNYIIRSRISTDEIFCNNCKSSFVITDVRKKSKIETPRGRSGDSTAYVNTTPDPVSQFADKGPEYKGGFKVLRDKGFKITSYRDSSEGKRDAD